MNTPDWGTYQPPAEPGPMIGDMPEADARRLSPERAAIQGTEHVIDSAFEGYAATVYGDDARPNTAGPTRRLGWAANGFGMTEFVDAGSRNKTYHVQSNGFDQYGQPARYEWMVSSDTGTAVMRITDVQGRTWPSHTMEPDDHRTLWGCIKFNVTNASARNELALPEQPRALRTRQALGFISRGSDR
jgi:hypothetical protein